MSTDPIFAAIEACKETDRIAHDQLEIVETDEAMQRYWDRFWNAEERLSETVPATWEGVAAKLQYMAEYIRRVNSFGSKVDYSGMEWEDRAVIALAEQVGSIDGSKSLMKHKMAG